MLDSGPCSYVLSAGTAQNVLRAGEELLCSGALDISDLLPLLCSCPLPASTISGLTWAVLGDPLGVPPSAMRL